MIYVILMHCPGRGSLPVGAVSIQREAARLCMDWNHEVTCFLGKEMELGGETARLVPGACFTYHAVDVDVIHSPWETEEDLEIHAKERRGK